MSTRPGLLITVLYKRTPDLHFDLEYYISHHMPLTIRTWKPHGLIDSFVTEALPDSEFAYTATTLWKDLGAWEAAQRDEVGMKGIMDDVGRYTNGTPAFVVGRVVL